jgi:hypothetical protein
MTISTCEATSSSKSDEGEILKKQGFHWMAFALFTGIIYLFPLGMSPNP